MSNSRRTLTRRAALVGATGTLAGVAALATRNSPPMPAASTPTSPGRLPVAFLPHGGGPWPFVDLGMGDEAGAAGLRGYLESVGHLCPAKPKALLLVSAHWEESVPTVMTSPSPPMLFDYYGFPPESYRLRWPAPGAPGVAARVRELLGGAGFRTAEDAQRGFDHGTFVPMMLSFPAADIPTLQLSLKAGLDPAEHLAMGRALAPLRDEGVFIVGSGMTFHDLRGFFQPRARPLAEDFDAWLRQSLVLDAEARNAKFERWLEAPHARQVHPREEHLLPLHVICGAAGGDRGTCAWNGTFAHLRLSAWHFGAA